MSYGSYACHATIISDDSLDKLCDELKIKMYWMDEIDDLYSSVSPFLDDMEREFCEIINSYSIDILPDDLDSNTVSALKELLNFIELIEERSGLILELNYVGETGGADDDLNQEFFWEVTNAFEYTVPAEKYKHYLWHANWVLYGWLDLIEKYGLKELPSTT